VAEAVIFDLGGVLTRSPFPILAQYAAEVGLAPELLAGSMRAGSEIMRDAEIGRSTMHAFVQDLSRKIESSHGRVLEVDRVIECLAQCVQPLPEAVELVRDVAKVHRVALLTNNTTDMRALWLPLLPAELFDVVVDSSEVGMRKHEPGIYHATLRLLGVSAAGAVFVDDQSDNVDAARSLGLEGVVFTDVDQARRELGRLGVLQHDVALVPDGAEHEVGHDHEPDPERAEWHPPGE
jgi:epoxide hydrolase-like predicted phosphatase